MQGAITSAPTAHAFDPSQWVDNFKQNGGWWLIRADEVVSMGWRLDGHSDEQNREARRLFGIIADDRLRRQAVRDVLLANQGGN